MNFERTQLWTSYAMVGVAFLAVALSGEIGTGAPVAFAVAFVASFFRRTDGPPRPATAQIWTAVLFFALGGLVLWSWEDGNWLLHALEFALLMTVSRLFQRRFAKDYLQLYALSFLLILVGAVVHPSLVFAACFVVYAVLAIWALTMVHLLREIEVQTQTGPEHLLPPPPPKRSWLPWRRKAPEPKAPLPDSPIAPETLQWRSRRLIGRGFLFASSLMALSALLVSMVFFFLFPRLGMGFFYAQTRSSQPVSGFSDAVKLGNFGNIKTSAEVVMRVRFPEEPERLGRAIRLRGLSFDHFDGRNWSRSEAPRWELHRLGQRYEVPRMRPPRVGKERGYLAHIYLEPLGTDVRVLFAPPRTRAISFLDSQYDVYRGRRKRVRLGLGGDFTFKAPRDTSLAYAVEVVEPISEQARRARLKRREGRKVPRWVKERWLQLPETLDPRIAKLATTLVGKERSPLERALLIESKLRRDWTYSLAGDQDPNDPLGDFLFGAKSGHCEYFATAMAVMMRTLGHPARVVNGYLGGQFNDFGDYRMIKQGDAHSWVEVYFPGTGWATFDPTPASGQLAPELQGLIGLARRAADGAAMLWYSWVVEYDLERQVEVMRRVGRALRKLGRGLKMPGSSRRQLRRVKADTPEQAAEPEDEGEGLRPWLPALALALLLVAAVVWWRRRRADGGAEVFDARLHRVLSRIERRLLRLELQRAGWQTWQTVAARVAEQAPGAATEARAFARAWDRARYDDDNAAAREAALQAAEAFDSALATELDARKRAA